MDCIFCKIAAGDIPSEIVFQDDEVLVFKDTNPQAPVHLLVIPKRHIKSVDELSEGDGELLGKIFQAIKKSAKDFELENGYRVVTNVGEDGGQSVAHLHFHVLGKRKLLWPPG